MLYEYDIVSLRKNACSGYVSSQTGTEGTSGSSSEIWSGSYSCNEVMILDVVEDPLEQDPITQLIEIFKGIPPHVFPSTTVFSPFNEGLGKIYALYVR